MFVAEVVSFKNAINVLYFSLELFFFAIQRRKMDLGKNIRLFSSIALLHNNKKYGQCESKGKSDENFEELFLC